MLRLRQSDDKTDGDNLEHSWLCNMVKVVEVSTVVLLQSKGILLVSAVYRERAVP